MEEMEERKEIEEFGSIIRRGKEKSSGNKTKGDESINLCTNKIDCYFWGS